MDIQKTCKICGETKSIDNFYQSQRSLKCKSCTLQETKEYKRSKRTDKEFRKIEGEKQRERRIRLWKNTLIHDSKHRGVQHTLKVEDIDQMFEEQKGLCYWFKVPLIPSENLKHPQQPSLDRLDRTKGYTKDNVVLSCYSANIGRNENSVEVWEEFIKKINV